MNYYKLLIVTSILLLITSCQKTSDIVETIPVDAEYVVRVDMTSLIKKSQYDLSKNSAFRAYRSLFFNNEKSEWTENLLKDPNSSGLNIKNEIYIFKNNSLSGTIIEVNDIDRLKETLIKLSVVSSNENIENDKDIYSAKLGDKVALIWNKKVFSILYLNSDAYNIVGKENPNLVELGKSYLRQEKETSILSSKTFVEFLERKQDISTYYLANKNLDIPFLDGAASFGLNVITSLQSIAGNIDGVSGGFYVLWENGKVIVSNKFFYDSPEIESKHKTQISNFVGDIKGNHYKYLPSEPIFITTVGLKGGGLYDYMKSAGSLETFVDAFMNDQFNQVDVENLLKSINGDVTLALTAIKKGEKLNYSDSYPEFFLIADLDNPKKMLDFVKAKLQKDKTEYTDISETLFTIKENYTNSLLSIGINNKEFYITNSDSVSEKLSDPTKIENKDNGNHQTKGKVWVTYGDINPIKSFFDGNNGLKVILPLLNEIDGYEWTVQSSDYSGEGKIEFQTKDKNSLAIVCSTLDQIINSVLPFMSK